MRRIVVIFALSLVFAPAAFAKPHPHTRSLADARVGRTPNELLAQITYSQNVETFFTEKHSWMLARRHANCWSHVPWAKTCNRARQTLRAHQWLEEVAAERLETLYPDWYAQHVIMQVFGPSVGPFAIGVARCESHFHVWAANGQYLGIFQMGAHERSVYGGSSSDVREQVGAAHDYYEDAGWAPWECA